MIRLLVPDDLSGGRPILLADAQARYLVQVMRRGPGDEVLVFNGRDGEWRSEVAEAGKRGGVLVCEAQTKPLLMPPDLWLMFAPIKKARTDFIVEKAVEMGARRILPVQTRHTNSERIRQDRLQAHAVEAAEQCGGTYVPEVADLAGLDRVLAGWPAERRILWCDESLLGVSAGLAGAERGPWAILIGPEGGFSEGEKAKLRGMPQVMPVSLGPRILRADTAAVAALALWQAAVGDWR